MKEKYAATVRRSRPLALVRFVTILSQNGWSILEKFVLLLRKLLIKIAINIRIGLIINFAVSVATTRERVMKEKHAATVRRSRLLALVRFVTILSQNGWSIL